MTRSGRCFLNSIGVGVEAAHLAREIVPCDISSTVEDLPHAGHIHARGQCRLPPHSATDFSRSVAAQPGVTILHEIVDTIGKQETHPLADLAETLALFIEAYEDAHVLSLNNPFSLRAEPTAQC